MSKKLLSVLIMAVIAVSLILLGRNIPKVANYTNDESKIANSSELTSEKNNEKEMETEESNVTKDNENKDSKTNNNNQQSSTGTNVSNNNSTNSNNNISNKNSENTQNKEQSKEKSNIIISNTVTGKTIVSGSLDFNGLTVSDATIQLLNKKGIYFHTKGSGVLIYFDNIGNVQAKGLSGWCYYINGKKLSVGAGSYKLNKNDLLEWKYLEDGTK